MLRELADEGRVEAKRKKLHHPGTLPSVTLADITGRDSDGELIATPDRMGRGRPRRRCRRSASPRRARPGPAKSPASATARCCASRRPARTTRPLHRPRHQDHRQGQGPRARHLPRAAGRRRTARADRQEAARPGARDSARRHQGRAGRRPRSRSSVARHGRLGLPTARVEERLGSIKSERAVSLIAIHAHDIPHVFPRAALAEAEAAQPADLAGREDWRKLAARHHRSGRRQGPRRRGPRRARSRSEQPRRLHRHASPSPTSPHYVRPGSALDREALKRGNSVYFPDRVVPMLPERISNDLCSLRAERGPRRARGAHDHRRRRPQALAHASIAC